MNIFINFSHPAHVHFFKNAVKIWAQRGHRIIAVSRIKEFTAKLLNSSAISHTPITQKGEGFIGLIKELLEQQIKIAGFLKKFRVHIMLQIGGIFNAPIGKLYQIPTLAFSDTENDKWGNKVSFTLSKYVFSPSCFQNEVGGYYRNQIKYPGYHELAYLSPPFATKMVRPENRFLLRFVGHGAGHDLREKWLSEEKKIEIIKLLESYGSVHISSEIPLPECIAHLNFSAEPSSIHDFMSKCRLIVGESATMASEAACLGIPAIFISHTGRGYTSEQDHKYDLIRHFLPNQWNQIISTIKDWATSDLFWQWQQKRSIMLQEKIDVTPWLVDLVENYPDSILPARQGDFKRYMLKCVD